MSMQSFLGLGTAALGRPEYINIRQSKTNNVDLKTFKEQGFHVLDEAYNLGIRYFDTAPGYGLAEQLLLNWLHTKNDLSIQVTTKWGYTYVANFEVNAKVHEVKEHSLEKLNEQWQVSKAFLPHLKVYQIHSATFETGVLDNQEILAYLSFLKNEHALEIGITTTGANQTEVLKKAIDVAVDGHQLFDAFQVTYNVFDQSTETLLNTIAKQNKRVIIKEALANGRLFRNIAYMKYEKLYDFIEGLAKKYDVGVDAIALKFCNQNINESIVLSGASNVTHLSSNLKANTITLLEHELNVLKSYKINPEHYWQERKQLHWN